MKPSENERPWPAAPCSSVCSHSLSRAAAALLGGGQSFFYQIAVFQKNRAWAGRGVKYRAGSGGKSTLGFRLARAAVAPIGAHDGLDELVPDDVAVA